MTIVRIAPASRLLVLWVGGEVPEAARLAFESRGVAIEASVPDGLEEQAALSAVTAAFFIQSATKPLRILPMIAAHAPRLLNYDSRVFVLATPNGIGNVVRCLMRGRIPALWASRTGQDSEVFNGRRIVRLSIGGEQPLPHVRVHPHNVPMDTVANFVLRHPAGPAPVVEHAGLFTGPGTSALNPDTRLLLRRAFFDCANVHLQPLAVGYSGAGVFVAHASLQEGLLGARPLPFFVKIAERDRIAAEYDRYEERVDPYVPFHLRPHLVRERCCLGVRFGVLVGDFVEHSEGLVSCARQGRAGPAIAALFERTLRGWHLQARLENRVIFGALRGWVRGQVPTMRIAAAGRLGVSRTPEQLRQAFEGLPSQEMLWGPLHADLHADNVRVRDGDAILIDFLSSREGPLVADPAALEASLVVSGPGDEYFDRTSWMKTVRLLYSQQSLRKPPRAPEAHDPFAWLHACVRQIRLYGLALERQPGQYAIALALALLRKALKDPNVSTAEEFRRINAYKLANTIADMHW